MQSIMDDISPLPELTAGQYVLLLLLLVLACGCNPLLSWLLPALIGTLWLTMLPHLLGLYFLLLLFRNLGIVRLPSVACYSALLAPLSALTVYQFVLL